MDYVELEDVLFVRETDMAALFEIDGEQHWIPWSQIEDNGEKFRAQHVYTIYITEWWAQKEQLD
jgi:hypothetical protein